MNKLVNAIASVVVVALATVVVSGLLWVTVKILGAL